jgi:GABA permease
MRNPIRSERDAFRMVLLAVGYFGLIGIGWKIERWLGVAVFFGLTIAGIVWVLRRGRHEPPPREAPGSSPHRERRILVVANETVGGAELLDELRRRAGGTRTVVLVVCPALNSPVRHWTSDEDGARAAAGGRLATSLLAMRSVGLDATGEVGDGDPLQAIEDALRTFEPDELVVSTHPHGRSHWLERGVVERARERFDIPLTHVVVDLGDPPQ